MGFIIDFFFQISEKGEGSKFYIFEKQGAKLLGGGGEYHQSMSVW